MNEVIRVRPWFLLLRRDSRDSVCPFSRASKLSTTSKVFFFFFKMTTSTNTHARVEIWTNTWRMGSGQAQQSSPDRNNTARKSTGAYPLTRGCCTEPKLEEEWRVLEGQSVSVANRTSLCVSEIASHRPPASGDVWSRVPSKRMNHLKLSHGV